MKRVPWGLLLLPALIILLRADTCSDKAENPLAEGEEFVASIKLTAIPQLSDGPPRSASTCYCRAKTFLSARFVGPGLPGTPS
jgi:hypothetical protein